VTVYKMQSIKYGVCCKRSDLKLSVGDTYECPKDKAIHTVIEIGDNELIGDMIESFFNRKK